MHRAYLLIEKGPPHEKGESILLTNSTTIIGRHALTDEPDISFSNPIISRNHLRIEWRENSFFATDQNSRNGTSLNGKYIDSSRSYVLHNGDRLSLANDTVVLLFLYEMGATTIPLQQYAEQTCFHFDSERRELVVDGKRIELHGNLFGLFSILYQNSGKAVSHQEIKKAVWPDRARDKNGSPNATEEEIHVLVMRLRKKLGDYGRLLTNVRGYGYLFDFK